MALLVASWYLAARLRRKMSRLECTEVRNKLKGLHVQPLQKEGRMGLREGASVDS